MSASKTLVALHKLLHQLPPDQMKAIAKHITSLPGRSRYSDYIKLYHALNSNAVFDEKKILNDWIFQFNEKKSIKYYQEAQYDLLKFLITIEIGIDPFSGRNPLEKRQMIADHLAKLDLMDLAFDHYEALTTDLQTLGFVHLAVSVVYKQLNIVPYTSRYNRPEVIPTLLAKLKALDGESAIYTNAYLAHYDFGAKYLNSPWPRSKMALKTLTAYIDTIVTPHKDNNELGLMTRLFLQKLIVWNARFAFNYPEAFEAQLIIINLIEDHKELITLERPALIYSEYLEIADLASRLYLFKSSNLFLLQAETAVELQKDSRVYRKTAILHTRLLLHQRAGRFEDALTLVENLISALDEQWQAIPETHRIIIIGTILKSLLQNKDYLLFNKLFDLYYNKEMNKSSRIDHWHLILLLGFCNAYEQRSVLANGVYLEQLNSLITYINKTKAHFRLNDKQFPFEKTWYTYMLRLAESNRIEQHKLILQGLLVDLNKFEDKELHYQQYFYEVFDFRDWVTKEIKLLG